MSSHITLSWSFTGLSLLTSKMYIKWRGVGEDFNRGFSYIISSWLMEEGQKPTVIILCIATFCLTSSKKKCIFSGGLLQYFIGIAILTYFSKAC